MSKQQDVLKAKLSGVSAKTLSLGAKQYMRRRNEQKIKFRETFAYDPLKGPKWIRLLSIHDGTDTDVIRCDVFEVDLGQNPSFEALSYTWDLDPQFSFRKMEFEDDEKREERPIICNGKTKHVTMNLYHALTEFRREKVAGFSTMPLWADQICINQDDSDEKVTQLGVMVDIYRSAARVTIWLGKLNVVLNSGINFIDKLPDEPPSRVKPALGGETKTNKISQSLSGMSSVGEFAHWTSAMLVIGKRWFSRAWTLQEFLLASNFRFLMGNREISPKSIIKASSQVVDFFSTDQLSRRSGVSVQMLAVRRVVTARATLFSEREKFKSGKRYSAEEYLGVIRNRRATERKDKIFAGSALLKQDALISTDYRSTSLDIYISYATACLYPETGIFAMSLVGGTAPEIEGLPTWVPDLSKVLRPEALQYCGCPISPTPLLANQHDFHINDRKLHVWGAKWDVVKATGESVWSWSRYDEAPYNSEAPVRMRTSSSVSIERFGLMFVLLNELGAEYAPTGERTIDAFWQTLIGGINLKSEEDMAVWRDRFQQWFAFTLINIRSDFRIEKAAANKKMNPESKKWMVPLIADSTALEERVSLFLDVHDQDIKSDRDSTSNASLRSTISHLAKRLGIPDLTEESGWKDFTADLLANIRREEFYTPVSVFSSHFELVYEGRRIFTSERGHLGAGTEAVRKEDLIYLVAGATVPYILRPVAGVERTFTLVGEAYIHGMMGGGNKLFDGLELDSLVIS